MDKKSQQLGLNYSTAAARLDRKILFWLTQKAGLDTCHRCGKRIESVEELSIEHKEPWRDVDPALFWDLDNIAFSHRKCNYAAGSMGKLKNHRRFADRPAGQSWCTGHKCYHDEKEFGWCKTMPNGLHYLCRAYRRSIGWQGGKYKKLEGLVHGQVRSS